MILERLGKKTKTDSLCETDVFLDKQAVPEYDRRQLFEPKTEISNGPHAAREKVPQAASTFPR
jgi:hypothetical protein